VKFVAWLAALGFAVTALPAAAGPPYLTDDPVPTDTGHWEIYAFTAGEGHKSIIDGDVGLDLNYGAAKGVQLTATVPLSFSRSPTEDWHAGTGDVELGVKYRFFHDEETGLSAAVFPRVILPTASPSTGEKTRLLLPLWLGKDFKGGTSVFGGGGYLVNPGAGNRDFWQAAIAITQNLNDKVSLGAELTRQGLEMVGGTAKTRAGFGSILKLSEHSNLLLSGGPTWADHQTAYHFYIALGLNY
jgi:hypothetical protein